MPVGHANWTVLPHDPIEKLTDNLWFVQGIMSKTNRRNMVLARLRDGRVIIHNAIALDEPSMAEIDAWGSVAAILIPNAYHRQDAAIMQARYPKAMVYAPRGALAAANKATPCSGCYRDVPTDDSVSLRELDGVNDREGVVLVHSTDGKSAVFCDTVLNLPRMAGIIGFALHPTGVVSVPRATRWLFAKDKRKLSIDLTAIAGTPELVRVIPGHGQVVATDAAARLHEAAVPPRVSGQPKPERKQWLILRRTAEFLAVGVRTYMRLHTVVVTN